MKQILPELQEIKQVLSFSKRAFTKGGFRHITNFIGGLICITKKTIRQISKACNDECHHNSINNLLLHGKFETQQLQNRYLKKLAYIFKGLFTMLIFDDTLAYREGKAVELAQYHKDHSSGNKFMRGHQFFTAILKAGTLEMPLFPQLYSKYSISKIDMAKETFALVNNSVHINTVSFDSWFSDKSLIKQIRSKGVEVVCQIKTNRKISVKRGVWKNLSEYSKEVNGFTPILIDNESYEICQRFVKLNGIAKVNLLISKLWDEKNKKWKPNKHLISTDTDRSILKVVKLYSQRWRIEVFHRDIKQNLGFDAAYVRKEKAVVRYAICVVLAYIALKLLMHMKNLNLTIGECCAKVQDDGMDGFIAEIIEIEDKKERISRFEEVFKRKTAQV